MHPERIIAALVAGLCLATPAKADDSIFRKLGGNEGITAIAQDAYAMILEDERIKADFGAIDHERLTLHLAALICQSTGGPCLHHVHALQPAQAWVGLSRTKSTALAEDLVSAMDQHGVPYWTQIKLVNLLVATRP